jgi:predicted metal-binding membrane protein
MWLAMAAAMMLPTAAPMIRTYAEIADTAAARGEPVVHPLVLTSGLSYGLSGLWPHWSSRRFS